MSLPDASAAPVEPVGFVFVGVISSRARMSVPSEEGPGGGVGVAAGAASFAGTAAGVAAGAGGADGAGVVGGGFTGTLLLGEALDALVSLPVALRTAPTKGSPPAGVGTAPVSIERKGTMRP